MNNLIRLLILQKNAAVSALYSQGKYDEALPVALDACDLSAQYYGDEDPGRACPLNNLALVYRAKGRYKEALACLTEAGRIVDRFQGKESPEYATSLNNMAGLRRAKGVPAVFIR